MPACVKRAKGKLLLIRKFLTNVSCSISELYGIVSKILCWRKSRESYLSMVTPADFYMEHHIPHFIEDISFANLEELLCHAKNFDVVLRVCKLGGFSFLEEALEGYAERVNAEIHSRVKHFSSLMRQIRECADLTEKEIRLLKDLQKDLSPISFVEEDGVNFGLQKAIQSLRGVLKLIFAYATYSL